MARRTLSAQELRRLAEAVDGVRDQSAYIVWGASGPEVKTRVGKGDDVMAECRTDNVVGERRPLASITIDPPVVDASGQPVTDVASRFDAMFWSESAVEKFLLPYLLRFQTPAEVEEIRSLFDQRSVSMIMHLPLSNIMFGASTRTNGRSLELLTPEELRAAL